MSLPGSDFGDLPAFDAVAAGDGNSRPTRYEESFFFLALSFARRLRATMAEEFSEIGISVPEFTAIMVLNSAGPLSNASLARHCRLSAQAMLKVTTSLSRANIIHRVETKQNREHLLTFTEEGAALMEEIILRLRRIIEQLNAHSSIEDHREFKRILALYWHELAPVDEASEPKATISERAKKLG